MKPIIGILAEVDNDLTTAVKNTYISAITASGGAPILLPYTTDDEAIDRFIDICDGFLFSGGADVEPERYGETPSPFCGVPRPYRDELDFKTFYKAMATDKPILAICRGMQLVNVALGGTLYQDIPSEYKTEMLHRQAEPVTSPSHDVNVITDTPLHVFTRKTRITANSFHHQAVKKLADGCKIMATADDGIIEAIYLDGERYLRAYQWHPERLCDTNEDTALIGHGVLSPPSELASIV